MTTELTARLADYAHLARDLGVDAVALAPGPNFDVYDTVLRANRKGHEVTRAGVTAHEIDDAVTGVLEASPHADRIRTKTGHGLGRDAHEAPYVMRGNHAVLEAGTVYTDERGLYRIGAFGVRIENDILVTANGCTSLTRFPTELTVLPC